MNIYDALAVFELSENEQEVFMVLKKYPWITALELSYKTEINRSTLYRILETLIKKSLVTVRLDDKTTYYAITGEDGFEQLLQEESVKYKQKTEAYSTMVSLLGITSSESKNATVKFHRGVRGIRHLEWKRAQNSKENLYIGIGAWYKHLGKEFAAEVRAEIIKNNGIVKEIINSEYFNPIKPNGLSKFTDNHVYNLNHFLHRHIDAKKIPLPQEIAITDTAVHLQSYEDDDLVGIEIESVSYAQMLKGMYKLIWNFAQAGDHRGGEDYPL